MNLKDIKNRMRFLAEYDSSKTREENISESQRVTKKVWDEMSPEKREEALLTAFSDPDDAMRWLDSKYDDLPPQAMDMRINEDVSDRERGIRMAQRVVDNIRAKHNKDKNWDDFIAGFVERINDAFNVNEEITEGSTREGKMAKYDALECAEDSKDVHNMITDDMNLPEWLEAKITLSADYMNTVKDYLTHHMKND